MAIGRGRGADAAREAHGEGRKALCIRALRLKNLFVREVASLEVASLEVASLEVASLEVASLGLKRPRRRWFARRCPGGRRVATEGAAAGARARRGRAQVPRSSVQ
jgi:hypothetical protein